MISIVYCFDIINNLRHDGSEYIKDFFPPKKQFLRTPSISIQSGNRNRQVLVSFRWTVDNPQNGKMATEMAFDVGTQPTRPVCTWRDNDPFARDEKISLSFSLILSLSLSHPFSLLSLSLSLSQYIYI